MITGASRGFGRLLADAALAGGDRVVTTARNVETIAGLGFPLRLDVRDAASVQTAVAKAIAEFGRIDVLVNNAGHGLVGALEEVTDAQLRAVLDTNVFGAAAVTRAVLPHMRARRAGHIVQLSSVGGVIGNPGHAAHSTSKFALEGMSEALAGEVAELGIRVSILEPGPFRTDFAGPASMTFADPIDDYVGTAAGRLRARFAAQDGNQPNDPARVVDAILKVVQDKDAPLRLPLSPEAVHRIRDKLTAQLADLDRWEAVSLDTRF